MSTSTCRWRLSAGRNTDWKEHQRFFPRDADASDVSIGIYKFRDEAAIHAALASPETEAVMADVSA